PRLRRGGKTPGQGGPGRCCNLTDAQHGCRELWRDDEGACGADHVLRRIGQHRHLVQCRGARRRQRQAETMKGKQKVTCPQCNGTGHVETTSSLRAKTCWPVMTPSTGTKAKRSSVRPATETQSARPTRTPPTAGATSGWCCPCWSASPSPRGRGPCP